jgi:transcriptional regulator with XRE-family HTH domain
MARSDSGSDDRTGSLDPPAHHRLPQWHDRRELRRPQARDEDAIETALAGLGARLIRERVHRGATLDALARRIGVSASTLSRLESGKRRPTLELLLRIAVLYGVTLDELVGLPGYAEFTVPEERVRHGGDRVVWRLTRSEVEPTPYKFVYSATESVPPDTLPTHRGWLWVFVLAGRLRVIDDGSERILEPGQAAEIDTARPHWTGSTGEGPVEVLALISEHPMRSSATALPGS